MPLENLIRFPAIGDWGGTEYASYYVPLQEWNAQLMDDLCVGLFKLPVHTVLYKLILNFIIINLA